MAKILGLDLGSHSVKALLIESTFRGYELRRYAEAPVGVGGLKTALAFLAAQKQLGADQVVVSLPGTVGATHLISLPFTDARRIEQTIGFEVEGVVPFDLADIVYDYQVVVERDGKSEILVAVARKLDVKQVIDLLAEVQIDPRVLAFSPLAYQSLLALPPDSDDAEAVVDIGHERTCVYIGTSRSPEFARNFSGGGRDLTRLIAADLGVSSAEAEELKIREGTLVPSALLPDSEKVANALVRGLAPIVREVRSTLRAHASRFRRQATRVRLTGGSSPIGGLPQHLTRELGVEVDLLSALPPQAEKLLQSGSEAKASQAFALALRGHGSGRGSRFNLRRGDFAFKGDFEYLKGKVVRLAVAAGILLALSAGAGWARLHTLSQRESKLDAALCQATQRVLGKCVKDYPVAISMLKGQGSPAAAIPQFSALDLFAEITTRTPSDITVKYDEIEVTLDRIRLRCEAPSFDSVDKIVTGLKTFRCFSDIKTGRMQKSRAPVKPRLDKPGETADKAGDAPEQVEFDLDIAVACPETGGGQG
jgi:general secretion pathway protein L